MAKHNYHKKDGIVGPGGVIEIIGICNYAISFGGVSSGIGDTNNWAAGDAIAGYASIAIQEPSLIVAQAARWWQRTMDAIWRIVSGKHDQESIWGDCVYTL